MVKYKWYLQYSTQSREAFPIWKDDLSLDYAFEQNQYFRRTSLSTSITFVGDDYAWIMNQPFGVKILVTIKAQWTHGGAYQDYWKGSFYITDCTINNDGASITVKPNVEDKYTKILAGLEKEFDLIKLGPAQHYVNMKRRPMLQVYCLGDDIVSCFSGGMAWEQDVTDNDISAEQIHDDYYFDVIGNIVTITFANAPTGLQTGMIGTFNTHGWQEGEWQDFGNEEGLYYMTYFQGRDSGTLVYNGLRIYDVGTNRLAYWFEQQGYYTIPPIPATFVMQSTDPNVPNLNATSSETNIYGRWCVAEPQSGMLRIPSNDIVAYNRNYKWCFAYSGDSCIVATSQGSSQTTKWGLKPDGTYYVKPTLTPEEQQTILAQYPVARSTWQTWSLWLQWGGTLELYDNDLSAQRELRDAYPIEAVISVLLKEVDSSLSFTADTAHSLFLYSAHNPVSAHYDGRIAITPKSNIIVAEYTQPDQTAPITLASVFNMLKNVFGLYWFVDDSNRLRIEHISWFKKGGSYASGGALVVGYDLTAIKNTRNGKEWSFDTDTYSYDRLDMPERYQYEWGDSTTDVFKGDAIEVLSGFVQEGKVEEINISNFNADLDYMMLNPSDVSEDGFALMFCHVSGTTWQVLTEILQIEDNVVTVQNAELTMVNLQPNLLVYDMPSWNIRVNGTAVTAKGIQRKKKQTVNVPHTQDGDIDMLKLVKTTVGNGEVERANIRLTSRTTKLILRYDTTQQ